MTAFIDTTVQTIETTHKRISRITHKRLPCTVHSVHRPHSPIYIVRSSFVF